MPGTTLDWSSAQVHDGKLEVGLRGERPPGWKDSFDQTVALLPAGDWGKIRLKKDRVRVHDVVEDDVDRLHNFLEGVVQQANAAQEEAEEAAPDDQEADDESADPRDAELTERFRSFAAEPLQSQPADDSTA